MNGLTARIEQEVLRHASASVDTSMTIEVRTIARQAAAQFATILVALRGME